MYTLIAQNKYGQKLELTHNEAYVIESIEGLDPPDAIINTTRNANADGSVFNSSYVDNRQIIITLAVNSPAEENRINLYRYFKNKYPVTLYYKNETRNVYINGYCKNIQIALFELKQIAQITIICPEPYFNGSENEIVNFSSVQPLFEFPFEIEEPIPFSEIILDQEKSILNSGDVETGVEIYLRARGPLTNPTIYNVDTNEFFKLTISMVRGDEIYINTKKKQKTVLMTHEGVTTNIIGNLASGSTWFQLNPGDNLFMTTAQINPENLDAYCVITDQFEGV